MKFETNAGSVRDRIAQLRDGVIPQALNRTLQPERWRALARMEAESTLRAIADPAQALFIPNFISTLIAGMLPDGFWLAMRSPFAMEQTVADFQAARAAVSPKDLGQNLFYQDLQRFDELITEWVATEKRKDARDAGKSDEEIGHFIAYLMLTPTPTPRERAAREKLMPHIVDFLQRRQAASRLPAEVVETWLRAVAVAWRIMICAHLPAMLKTELRATALPEEGRKAA
jgi:hypothetical protein